MNKNPIFNLFAILLSIAGIYHVVGIISPDSLPPIPIWRHSLFAAINVVGIYLILKRPAWAFVPFTIVTIFSLYSHGSRFIRWWAVDGRVDIISILVIFLLPLMPIMLLRELLVKNKDEKEVQ